MASIVNYQTLVGRALQGFAWIIVVKPEINLWQNYVTSENVEFFIIHFFYQLYTNENKISIYKNVYGYISHLLLLLA